MSILMLIALLIALGVVGWLVDKYAPISAGFKTLVRVALIVIGCYFLADAIGLMDVLRTSVPHIFGK